MRRGLTTQRRRKSIYPLGGLTEGTGALGLLVLICLRPGSFAVLARASGGTCRLTTASRVAAAVQAFRGQKRGDPGVKPHD
jgi:hypothetical protein